MEYKGKLNVLAYMDKDRIDYVSPTRERSDSTDYVVKALSQYPDINVKVESEKDPKYAENADVVLVRFNPPVDHGFLEALEEYDNGLRLFLNPPASQMAYSSKHYLEDFPDITPGTLISNDPKELARFAKQKLGGRFVYKPLDGMGGEGIMAYLLDSGNERELEYVFRRSLYVFIGIFS